MADREQWSNRELISAAKMNRVLNAAYDASENLPIIQKDLNELKASKADNLEFDTEENLLYLVSDGQRIGDGVAVAASGGGGGGSSGSGSSTNNAILKMQNLTGWQTTTIPTNQETCTLRITWSSLDNDDNSPTGGGILQVIIGGTTYLTRDVDQGEVTFDIKKYLSSGNNKVQVRIIDIANNMRSIYFTINCVNYSLESSFLENFITQTQTFSINYTPYGEGNKTMHFKIDDTDYTIETNNNGNIATYNVTLSGTMVSLHGTHSLKMWFTTELNGVQLPSNVLSYEFIVVNPNSLIPIISSVFPEENNINQYETAKITYRVHLENAITTPVTIEIYKNGGQGQILINTITEIKKTDETLNFSYYFTGSDDIMIRLKASSTIQVTRDFYFTVTAVSLPIELTANAKLSLSSNNKINDSNKDVWEYNNGTETISAIFEPFKWDTTDGWVIDTDGITGLRVSGTDIVSIPANLLDNNTVQTYGATIEFEFSVQEISNYNNYFINVGNYIKINPSSVNVLYDNNKYLSVAYKELEKYHFTIVYYPNNANSLIYVYINGILSGARERVINLSATGGESINIGSSTSTVNIYKIRAYDFPLSSKQVISNWIMDSSNAQILNERFEKNSIIYNTNTQNYFTPNAIPSYLPYMILKGPLPEFKEDAEGNTIYTEIDINYVDNSNSENSFVCKRCSCSVQGTSSSVYYRKNYDLQFHKYDKKYGENHLIRNGVETTETTYALRGEKSIPFDRFVLKADVASCESANNVELVDLFNDTNPYTNPQQYDYDETTHQYVRNKVRQGIEGIPIVVFHQLTRQEDEENGTPAGQITFLGKYNFNLPKRAFEPYGFDQNNDYRKTLESWEWQINTSPNVLFKTADFKTLVYKNEDEEGVPEEERVKVPAWTKDFEARFPKDYTDYKQLREFLEWVKSTYRNSDDSEENSARLKKFKDELENYVEKESAIFYYLFTEFFLMVDSRAKNMFPSFNGAQVTEDDIEVFANNNIGNNAISSDEAKADLAEEETSTFMRNKVTFMPYDMDTALGINNTGYLTFNPYLEDTSKVSSLDADPNSNKPGMVYAFNGAESVFWNNLRDAFKDEIRAMYVNLRTSNIWNYDNIINRFKNHQSKWSEAIFNEDAYQKYIIPIEQGDTSYLKMVLGSKEAQREWWLWNRFNYFDSKYGVGSSSANENLLIFRVNSEDDTETYISLTPLVPAYLSVKFSQANTRRMKKADPNDPNRSEIQFYVNPTQNQNDEEQEKQEENQLGDVESAIYSIHLLTQIDFSHAGANQILQWKGGKNLRNLYFGHEDDAELENATITELKLTSIITASMRENNEYPMLEILDCTNCSGLTASISLEGFTHMKEAYFSNSAITSFTSAQGAPLHKIKLPDSIVTLNLQNADALINETNNNGVFSVDNNDYSNLRTLIVNNYNSQINTVFPLVNIINAMVPSTVSTGEAYGIGLTNITLDFSSGNINGISFNDFINKLLTAGVIGKVYTYNYSTGISLIIDKNGINDKGIGDAISGNIILPTDHGLSVSQLKTYIQTFSNVTFYYGNLNRPYYLIQFFDEDASTEFLSYSQIRYKGQSQTVEFRSPSPIIINNSQSRIFTNWSPEIETTATHSQQYVAVREDGYVINLYNNNNILENQIGIAELSDTSLINQYPSVYSYVTDAKYIYYFDYWMDSNQNRVDEYNNASASINLFPHYNQTLREYQVTWRNLLSTITYSNVPYGSIQGLADIITNSDTLAAQTNYPYTNEPETSLLEYDGFTPSDILIVYQAITRTIIYKDNDTSDLRKFLRRTLRIYESEGSLTESDISKYRFTMMPQLDIFKLNTIDKVPFDSSSSATKLVITGNTIPTLSDATSINRRFLVPPGGIFVPDNMVSEYHATDNWSLYADQIFSITKINDDNIETISDNWIDNNNNGILNKIAQWKTGAISFPYNKWGIKKIILRNANNSPMYVQLIDIDETNKLTTWLTHYAYSSYISNPSSSNWGNGDLAYNTLNNTVFSLLPEYLQDETLGIKTVEKKFTNSSLLLSTASSKLWLPSISEIVPKSYLGNNESLLALYENGVKCYFYQPNDPFSYFPSTSFRRMDNGEEVSLILRTHWDSNHWMRAYNWNINEPGFTSVGSALSSDRYYIFGFCI